MNNNIIALSGSKTQAGSNTEFNTDAIIDFSIPGGHVYAVSDGRDGENGHAALAAKLTVESIKKYFNNKVYKNMANALTNAVSFANYSVFEQAKKDSKYAGIGASIAVLIYHEGKVYYAYAGDSRVYILNNGELKALTKDHLPESDNPTQEVPEVLIGRDKDIKFGVCINPINVEQDYQFLVCTDGLNDCLSSQELQDVLNEEDTSAEHKAMLMVEKAGEKSPSDCLSLHIVEFGQASKAVQKSSVVGDKSIIKTVVIALIVLVGASLIGFLAFKGYVKLSQVDKVEQVDIVIEEQAKTSSKASEAQAVDVEELEAEEAEIQEPIVITKDIEKESSAQVEDFSSETAIHKHQVKYGENLYRLGLRYNVSQDELIRVNGNKATNLVADSYINIPVKAVCVVKAGESWSVISDRYNVKIKSIAKSSDIEASISLKKGQTLIIPLK